MKHKLLHVFLLTFFTLSVNAQTSEDYTVQVNTTIQANPAKIIFNWSLDTTATNYTVARKLKSSSTWNVIAANLPGTSVQFEDTNVLTGNAFEYRITRITPVTTGITYLYAGIEVPATEQRGKLIFLVDNTFSVALANELEQLTQDFTGDGWKVIRHDVSPADSVPSIKALIMADYNADMTNTKAVFIFGHVPVPYSGNLNPDGHPDHLGAWPADVYYGEMNGNWTDISVNDSGASRIQNRNVPGDGKFDQTLIPSQVELQVGRVDFANLPAFSITEQELLRRYLVKDHNYRVKNFSVRPRALVDDNFGAFGGEAFASNGWRLCGLVGADSVSSQDYFSTLNSESYQWSYGCGGGSYTSCGGVGTTTDFVNDSNQTIFSMLFGSYFGDWDSQDNLMRSSLASGTSLTCSWAGRPHWHYHHMALGENIGYSTLITQNNSNTYVYNYAGRYVHMALMGDPTLRMHIVAPPSNLTAIASGLNEATLNWNASADSVLGYHVYRLDTSSGFYIRISPSIITALSFVDTIPAIYENKYMVRAVKLEDAATGTYYNLSTGIMDSVLLANGIDNLHDNIAHVSVFPNPSEGNFSIEYYCSGTEAATIKIFSSQGQLINSKFQLSFPGQNKVSFKLDDIASGIYFIKVAAPSFIGTQKLMIE